MFNRAVALYKKGNLPQCCRLLIAAREMDCAPAKRFLGELADSPDPAVRAIVEQAFWKSKNPGGSSVQEENSRENVEETDVPADPEKEQWRKLQKKADSGNQRAQYEFGRMCLESGNRLLAKEYLGKASEQGHIQAGELLRKEFPEEDRTPKDKAQVSGFRMFLSVTGICLSLIFPIVLGFYYGRWWGGLLSLGLIITSFVLLACERMYLSAASFFLGLPILLYFYGGWHGVWLVAASNLIFMISCGIGNPDGKTAK